MKSFAALIISLFLLTSMSVHAECSLMQKRIDEKESLNNKDPKPYSFHQFINKKKEQNNVNYKQDGSKAIISPRKNN